MRVALRIVCGSALPKCWLLASSAHFANATRCANFGSATAAPLQVCIVGAGPSGFYTADKLLKTLGDGVRVDLLDRLPTPFGLVRSGVAPDHQDTKNVTRQFAAVGRDPRCSFFGNVTLGRDIALRELRTMYHAVVLSYGAESDRRLGIPGEVCMMFLGWQRVKDAPGVLSAREFVWWYNGHPDARDLPVDLSRTASVAICGVGNVALDCARLLLQPPRYLEPTDVATHAMHQLRSSNAVRAVHLIARRGPVQAACTPKELKELLAETGVVAYAAPDQMLISDQDEAEMKAVRMKRRIYELIAKAVGSGGTDKIVAGSSISNPGAARALHFQFYRKPVEVVLDRAGHAAGVRVECTQLQRAADGHTSVAVGTGRSEVIPAQLVLKSIGYKSLPVEGVAFDATSGIVPSINGRVLKQVGSADVDEGLYVCGWLRRGPSGIIGTNLVDAAYTVEAIVADAPRLADLKRSSLQQDVGAADGKTGALALSALLQQRNVQYVSFIAWDTLDAAELAAGQAAGRVREKVVDIKTMLQLAGSAQQR